MPFGKYADFSACIKDNADKQEPEAYCAQIHKNITGKWPSEKEGFNLIKPIAQKLANKYEEETNFKEIDLNLDLIKKFVGKFIDNPVKTAVVAYLVYKILKPKVEAESYSEAEYNGRDVELNKPFRTPDGAKKFAVYVKDGNKVKKVTFGDSDMEIKRDKPEARKAFRARHKCDQQKDRTSATYWSCKMWQSDKTVNDILNEDLTMDSDLVQTKLFNGWKFNKPRGRSVWSASKNGVFVDVDKYGDNEYVIRLSGARKDQWKINKQHINRDIKQIIQNN